MANRNIKWSRSVFVLAIIIAIFFIARNRNYLMDINVTQRGNTINRQHRGVAATIREGDSPSRTNLVQVPKQDEGIVQKESSPITNKPPEQAIHTKDASVEASRQQETNANKQTSKTGGEILRAADVVSIPDVAVFDYDPEKAWRTSDTCRTIDRKMYLEDFVRIPLLSPVGKMPVYIHEPKRDGISNRVYKSREFEPSILNLILMFLRSGDDINFVDIGANIGLHTLAVLKIGRKVISLEAVKDNVVHICATAHDLGFHENIRVIHNAVGADHQPSMFHLGRNGTFGDNFVDVKDSKIRQNKFRTDGNVYQNKATPMPTVMIDDLLTMPDQTFFKEFRTNFIKLDVEGSEMKVLEGAKKFLGNTKVVGVIMEWRWHRGQPSAAVMVNILKSFGFEAYKPSSRKSEYKNKRPTMKELNDVFSEKLDYSKTGGWPHDVVWVQSKL